MDKVYVVKEGEFETLRVRKNQYKLIDPIGTSLLGGLDDDQITKHIGPRSLNFKPHKRYESVKVKNGAKPNNTLYRGQRGQAGEMMMNIVCPGQLIGWDDVTRERVSTKSMRCISNKGTLITLPSKLFLRLYNTDKELKKEVRDQTIRRDAQTLCKIIKTKSAIRKLTRPSVD